MILTQPFSLDTHQLVIYTQPLDITWPCSSQNQFVPELVRRMACSVRLVLYIILLFFFKLSIDKWHTSAFNALIYVHGPYSPTILSNILCFILQIFLYLEAF